MSTHQIDTEIEIEANADQVWAILADFPSYPKWNPFICSIAGVPLKGARLQIQIQPNKGKAIRFSPVVMTVQVGRELRWHGRLLIHGLFDGEHSFVIEPLADSRVRFKQSERFSGVLVPLLRPRIERDTRQGFKAMNEALKERAESVTLTEREK